MDETRACRQGPVFRFAAFQVSLAARELRKSGMSIRLSGQPFSLLVMLLEKPGDVITREEMRQKLWPSDTFVDFEHGLNSAIRKLRSALGDSPENPRYLETIPRVGYRFIGPVVCEQPSASDGSVKQLEATSPASVLMSGNAGELLATVNKGERIHVMNRSHLRYYGSGLAIMLAVIALALIAMVRGNRRSAQIPVTPKMTKVVPRPAVAIMEFENATGRPDTAWLAIAIPEMLSTELAAGGKLSVIPNEDVARMAQELHLEITDALAAHTAVRVATDLNVNLLVGGSYVVMGAGPNAHLRIDLRLQDARTGEVIAELAESGKKNALFDMVSDAGSHIRERLGLPGVSADEQVSVRTSMPANSDAARLYAKGLALLRSYDAAGARDLLEEAVAAEPNFPLSHSALAAAWHTLGYGEKARAEAKKAFELSGKLPTGNRLLIEGRYHSLWDQPAQAVSAYRALFALFPDSVYDGWLLAEAQVSAGKPDEALNTIKTLRALPSPLCDDPRIDMAEADSFNSTGDLQRQNEALEHAREKATARGSVLLAAKAELDQAWPLNESGNFQQAKKLAQAALPVFAQAGDRGDLIGAAQSLGDSELWLNNFPEALNQYRRALRFAQDTGDAGATANVFNEMAIVYEMWGNPRRAESLYRQSYESFAKVGNRRAVAIVGGNVGLTLVEQGKLQQAEKLFQQEIDLGYEVGSRSAQAGGYSNMALVAFARGQLDSSRRFTEQSVAIRRELGHGSKVAVTLAALAEILRMQGNLVQARQEDAEALSFEEKNGAKVLAGEARLTLAQIDLDERNAVQAEPLVRGALLVFSQQNSLDDEIHALAVLSRCLLMQNKVKDAAGVLDQGRKLAAESQNPASHLRFAIADARVTAARARDTKSTRLLNEALSELLRSIYTARRLGFGTLEYQARLAFAEIQINADPAVGKRYASVLAQDARAHGFQLVANRAAALP